MPSSESWKSWKRLAPCRSRSRRIRQVQLDPMTSSVRATGQSAMSCFWLFCFCMKPSYPTSRIWQLTSKKVVTIKFGVINNPNGANTMTLQIPAYLLAFESAFRPLVAAIALGLIWMGAARMPAPPRSRYATAGVLSVILLSWLGVAQYLASKNVYFANTDTAVPTVLFGLLIPLATAAIGLWRSRSVASLVSAIPLP